MQVNRLRFGLGLTAILLAAPAIAAPQKTPAERIYKVDTVTVATDAGKLVVSARGAVSSGGWTNAHLHPIHSGVAHVMAFEFVALPPPPDAAVIKVLVPIEAEATAPLPRAGVKEVRVDAGTNDATAAVPDTGDSSQ